MHLVGLKTLVLSLCILYFHLHSPHYIWLEQMKNVLYLLAALLFTEHIMLLLLRVKNLSFDFILYTLTTAITKFLYSEKFELI